MYVAQFRADATYTSQITSAVWIDPTALRSASSPGPASPAAPGRKPPNLGGALAARAVAAFNGGFRFKDAARWLLPRRAHGGAVAGREPHRW